MADADYHDGKLGPDDLVDDAVLPDAQAIGVFGALELPDAGGEGVVGERPSMFTAEAWMMRPMTCRSIRLSSRSAEGFHSIW